MKKMIVGLGNPGIRYRKTRHNIGWRVLDEWIARSPVKWVRKKTKLYELWSRKEDELQSLYLAKPLTYMNESGKAIFDLIQRLDIVADEDLLVLSDDADLPLGRIRLRRNGRSGGQRGLKDIIERLGRDDFARLRVGIGREGDRAELKEFVLQAFSKEEATSLSRVVDTACSAIDMWLDSGIEKAMNEFNARKDVTED